MIPNVTQDEVIDPAWGNAVADRLNNDLSQTVLDGRYAPQMSVTVKVGGNIQAALDVVRLAGGGEVIVQPGAHVLTLADHPIDSAHRTALVIGANTTLTLTGAVLKLAADQTSPGSANSLMLNYNIGAGGDQKIAVVGGTFDGNAVNQTIVTHGIALIRAAHCRMSGTQVKNCRGTAASGASETFHFDAQYCSDVTYETCRAFNDDGGSAASGFSANVSTGVRWIGCVAHAMSVANGFTHSACTDVHHVSCHSFLNVGAGFNSEVSDDVSYVGCTAGGVAPSAVSYPYTAGQSLGNTGSGYTLNVTTGFSLIGCVARKNSSGVFCTAGATGRIIGGAYRENGFGISAPTPGEVECISVDVTGNTTANFNGPSGYQAAPDYPYLSPAGGKMSGALGVIGAAGAAIGGQATVLNVVGYTGLGGFRVNGADASFPIYLTGAGTFRMGSDSGQVILAPGLTDALAAKSNPTDGQTAIAVLRNVGGTTTLQVVTMGAADSGGAGFKVLRVPN